VFEITELKQDEKVEYQRPSAKFYEAVGGEEGMKKLMYKFYDIIYDSDINNFFPQDIEEFNKVKEKNTKFFIQLCGGPKVYEDEAKGMDLDEYMIRVHDDFTVTEKSRIEWLGCMREALSTVDIDDEIKEDFWNYCDQFSKLTVNQYEEKGFNPYHH